MQSLVWLEAPNRPEPIIGIDLGTTYSVIAALDADGRPLTVPNRHGDLSTPSVVLFEENCLIVGKEAQRLALLEPDRVAERQARYRIAFLPPAGRGPSDPTGSDFGSVLKRLKADAERRLGPIRQAVITVPAYFDHTRREATCQAARLAGLEVADLLNEPIAAALAYGLREGFLDLAGTLDGRKTARSGVMTVVVYDLGGGTFDVTVMQIRDRTFKTLATDGDVRLGGRDWDRRIVDHVAARCMAEHPKDDPRDDPVTRQALFKEAEEAKRALSERSKTRLVYVHRGRQVGLTLSRTEFNELTADLLERTRVTTKLVLKETGLEWTEVDKLLLSGGSTRMPQVSRMLRELSGQEPDRSMSPDEAVAHGAALYHGILRRDRNGDSGAGGPAAKVVNVNVRTAWAWSPGRHRPTGSSIPFSFHGTRRYPTPGARSFAPARQVSRRFCSGSLREKRLTPRPVPRSASFSWSRYRPGSLPVRPFGCTIRMTRAAGSRSRRPLRDRACERRSRSPAGDRRSARISRTGP